MSTIDEEVQQLKARATAAEKARLMAEHNKAVASQEVEKFKKILEEAYQVTTKEQALKLLSEFEEKLGKKISEINDLLKKAEEVHD